VSAAQEKAGIQSSRVLAKVKWVERRMRGWWSCDISSLKAAVPPDDVSDAKRQDHMRPRHAAVVQSMSHESPQLIYSTVLFVDMQNRETDQIFHLPITATRSWLQRRLLLRAPWRSIPMTKSTKDSCPLQVITTVNSRTMLLTC